MMNAKKTSNETEKSQVKNEVLSITVRKALEIFGVMNKVDEAEVEFDNYLICDDLILNKKCLEPHVEAFNLLNKSAPQYLKYLRAHESAKNRFAGKPAELKAERDRIEADLLFIAAKEAEMDRIDKVSEELDRTIIVKGIRLIDRKSASGELTIKSKSGKGMHFISVIGPFFKETAE